MVFTVLIPSQALSFTPFAQKSSSLMTGTCTTQRGCCWGPEGGVRSGLETEVTKRLHKVIDLGIMV